MFIFPFICLCSLIFHCFLLHICLSAFTPEANKDEKEANRFYRVRGKTTFFIDSVVNDDDDDDDDDIYIDIIVR
jgi:hypothetical protein